MTIESPPNEGVYEELEVCPASASSLPSNSTISPVGGTAAANNVAQERKRLTPKRQCKEKTRVNRTNRLKKAEQNRSDPAPKGAKHVSENSLTDCRRPRKARKRTNDGNEAVTECTRKSKRLQSKREKAEKACRHVEHPDLRNPDLIDYDNQDLKIKFMHSLGLILREKSTESQLLSENASNSNLQVNNAVAGSRTDKEIARLLPSPVKSSENDTKAEVTIISDKHVTAVCYDDDEPWERLADNIHFKRSQMSMSHQPTSPLEIKEALRKLQVLSAGPA